MVVASGVKLDHLMGLGAKQDEVVVYHMVVAAVKLDHLMGMGVKQDEMVVLHMEVMVPE